MYKITIDASTILPRPERTVVGVSRTTYGLVSQLARMELPFELSLFGQRLRGKRLDALGLGLPSCHLPLPGWSAIQKMTRAFPVIETLCGSDLYHIPHNYAPFHALEKCVVTVHDAMFLSFPEPHLGHEKLAREIPPFARRCRGVITCSEHSKNDIVEYMQIDPKKIFVIPWGIEPCFRPAADPSAAKRKLQALLGLDKPFFLSVSCGVGRKNTPKLVEDYLTLARQDPENDLVLVWSRPDDATVAKIAGDAHGERVHILQGVSDEMLILLYQASTATVFPSFYEGFGLPVLEAMACGSPVITTPFSSIPEVGGSAVMYVDPGEGELLTALEQFERSEIGTDLMSEAGLAQAGRFTWHKCAMQTIDVYRKLLEK